MFSQQAENDHPRQAHLITLARLCGCGQTGVGRRRGGRGRRERMERGHGGRRSDTVRPAQARRWHLRHARAWGHHDSDSGTLAGPGDDLAVRQPERPRRVAAGTESRTPAIKAHAATKPCPVQYRRTTGALSSVPWRPHVLVWPWEERPTSVATTLGDRTVGHAGLDLWLRFAGIESRGSVRLGLSCVSRPPSSGNNHQGGTCPAARVADALFVDLRSRYPPCSESDGARPR